MNMLEQTGIKLNIGKFCDTTRRETMTVMKEMRLSKNLRIADIARETIVNDAIISRLERGMMLPSANHKLRLEAYFGMKLEELLTEIE